MAAFLGISRRGMVVTFVLVFGCMLFNGCAESASPPATISRPPLGGREEARRLWYYDRYDKFEQKRQHELTAMDLHERMGLYVNMTLSYEYRDGGRPSDARSVGVVFTGVGRTFRGNHDLTFLVDGRAQRIDSMVVGDGLQVVAVLSNEDFHRIAQARKVEGRVGVAEFVLTDDQLAHVKKFEERASAHPGSRSVERYTRSPASLGE